MLRTRSSATEQKQPRKECAGDERIAVATAKESVNAAEGDRSSFGDAEDWSEVKEGSVISGREHEIDKALK